MVMNVVGVVLSFAITLCHASDFWKSADVKKRGWEAVKCLFWVMICAQRIAMLLDGM